MIRNIKRREIIKALKKIGYHGRPGRSKHLKFEYFDSEEIKRITVSIPKGRRELPAGTLAAIRDRIRLSSKQFDDAVTCPLKSNDYKKIVLNFIKEGKL